MMKLSRRSMFALLPAAGLSLSQTGATMRPRGHAATEGWTGEVLPLTHGWEFRYGDASLAHAENWSSVQVPHTWQALGGDPHYVGTGTYRLALHPDQVWRERWVRLECEAAFHTARVMLDGHVVGEHIGKGYTAFTSDLSPALNQNSSNELMITVNNEPSDTMLPRNDSYDWANDGGLIRPVNLVITPLVFIERVEMDAQPDSSFRSASVAAKVIVRNAGSEKRVVELRGRFWPEKNPQQAQDFAIVQHSINSGSSVTVELPLIAVESPSLWHFDTPDLYAAEFVLQGADGVHRFVETFGIRTFEVQGTGFYLNGKPLSFMGVERMAGSNPDYGMAETGDWIRNNHNDLKTLNCLYTRVHWPQDKRVLEYCDRNGILMQEEIPAWGGATFHETTDAVQHALEQNGIEQLREMVARDRNHPCIVTWGLCNEVDGKNPRTRQFAHVVSREATSLDPRRLQTYASNTLFQDPGTDMAGDFSFVSTNEYYGSWEPGGVPDVEKHIAGIRAAFPDKPIVVSEYGWCECKPSVLPGDDNRVDIVNGHTDVFRDGGQVAGAIYFDYNDYRTLVGDKGMGAFRQRVHGVVDLYAKRKPSFEALRLQSSPFTSLAITRSVDSGLSLQISVRERLPGYTLHGYQVRWVFFGYDDLPMGGHLEALPDLEPGMQHSSKASDRLKDASRISAEVLRPNGFVVASAELLLRNAMH